MPFTYFQIISVFMRYNALWAQAYANSAHCVEIQLYSAGRAPLVWFHRCEYLHVTHFLLRWVSSRMFLKKNKVLAWTKTVKLCLIHKEAVLWQQCPKSTFWGNHTAFFCMLVLLARVISLSNISGYRFATFRSRKRSAASFSLFLTVKRKPEKMHLNSWNG